MKEDQRGHLSKWVSEHQEKWLLGPSEGIAVRVRVEANCGELVYKFVNFMRLEIIV